MFTMLCINGTNPHPLPRPLPFGCMIFFFWLAGGSAHPPLGVPASPPPPPPPSPPPVVLFPLPCARCSVVYISSPRRGARAPRDMILSLVLAPGALHKEGGGEAGTWTPDY
uniref:Uncharacterized protein n=1 Tax=Balaenoptera musculus TaxID=9771 RepID=A0A8C0D7K0_BALMU